MAFNSFHFILFLPVVLFGYFALPSRMRLGWLFAAGLYFYMAWRTAYIVLLLGATGVAYGAGLALDRTTAERHRRAILAASLAMLLGALFVFKYFNFFAASIAQGLQFLGAGSRAPHLELLLPLGISFYTFQKAGYLIDVYRGTTAAERNVGRFLLFATFFPQLVAGPIERAKNLLPQLARPVDFDYARVVGGLRLVAWGFFKKVVVADRLAPFVQLVYANPTEYSGASLLVATVSFAFQVYCDFSGYTDIALGTAQVFGVTLTQNFRQPYFATSIADFWKRWHVTLTTWLTDFVYTPLTRSRALRLPWYPKLLLCLILTFLISGLWHGAAWHFVLWGGLHGSFLVASFLTQRQRRTVVRLARLDHMPAFHTGLRIVFTFSLVCLSYVFFRAEQVTDAVYIVTHMFTGLSAFAADVVNGQWSAVSSQLLIKDRIPEFTLSVFGVAVVLVADAVKRWELITVPFAARPFVVRWATYVAAGFVMAVCGAFFGSSHTFIYFQF